MVGMVSLSEIVTPAPLVDRNRLVKNIEDMAERARRLGVVLRPHAKTHKSPTIAALQREQGAVGLTVATVAEAEVFAGEGVEDLLLSSPPVGEWRLDRVVALAKRAHVRVTVDNVEVVAAVDRACRRGGTRIGYLWELDSGVGRFGTPPGAATAELIEQAVARASYASFDGLFTFGGHAYAATDRQGIIAAARDERQAIAQTADALSERGIEAQITSVGSTPTAHVMEPEEAITEIRPGNYVFYDATQVALGIVPLEPARFPCWPR